MTHNLGQMKENTKTINQHHWIKVGSLQVDEAHGSKDLLSRKEAQVDTTHLTTGMHTPLIIYMWKIKQLGGKRRLGDLVQRKSKALTNMTNFQTVIKNASKPCIAQVGGTEDWASQP